MKCPFLKSGTDLDNRRQGNLGEFITYWVAHNNKVYSKCLKFLANAAEPLSAISQPNLDLTFVLFGELPSDDLIYIQEVKTTTSTSLSYADALVTDHEKLFGEDLALTLQSRIQVISFKFEHEHNRPDYAERVLNISNDAPSKCARVRLVPTLVHEKNGTKPVTKLVEVRTAIAGKGWPASSIEPWSISLTDLKDRLKRLTWGQP